MQRKAVVASINPSGVNLLSLDEVENSCGNAGPRCSTGCGCRVSGRPFKAALPKALNINTGDTVEVKASNSQVLLAFILIFGLPVAGGTAGWFTVTRLLQNSGDWFSVAGAMAGILLAGAFLLFAGHLRRNKGLPEIVAVLNSTVAKGEATT